VKAYSQHNIENSEMWQTRLW